MPVAIELIQKYLTGYPAELMQLIADESNLITLPAKTGILKQGQYVKSVPIVLKGLLKVFTQHDDKELLLYYIHPNESCVMSFTAVLNNSSSKIFAITEDDSDILLLPAEKMQTWLQKFPSLGALYHQLYYLRYNELIETIQQLMFEQLDKRLLAYIKEKSLLKKTGTLQILHREIAADLGTSREVITRILKKLEREGLLEQTPLGIRLK
jgi:CRP/FNR family transcriptional regulator, anaerobic regulatory protein